MKCLKLIFLMIFFSKLVVAEEEKVSVEKREVWYQLQKQDSLGELLYGLGIGPLWGKHGFVAKTFHLNKDILPAPDTLPSAGTWIQLPVTQGWQSSTAQKKYANHLLYKVVEVKVHKQLKKQVQSSMEQNGRYQIQKGDTLGGILFGLGIGPLWGAHGFVQKTVELNQLKNAADLPEVGEWITLPTSKEWVEGSFQEASYSGQSSPHVDLSREKISYYSGKVEELNKKLEVAEKQIQLLKGQRTQKAKRMIASGEVAKIDLLRAVDQACEGEEQSQFEDICAYWRAKKGADRAPQALNVMHSNKFYSDWGTFGFFPGLLSTQMSSKDTAANADATLTANLHSSFEVDWRKEIKGPWSMLGNAHIELLEYADPGDFEVESGSSFMMRLSGGARYSWTDKLFVDFKGGLSSLQILNNISSGTITVGTVHVPFGQTSLRYEGIYYGPLSLSFEVGGKAFLPASADGVTVENGFGGYVVIDQRIAVNESNLIGGALIADYGSINAESSSNSIFTMGGKVFWIWKP